jgi:DNA-directed RNA polymerase subunit RPC12/RpoP
MDIKYFCQECGKINNSKKIDNPLYDVRCSNCGSILIQGSYKPVELISVTISKGTTNERFD